MTGRKAGLRAAWAAAALLALAAGAAWGDVATPRPQWTPVRMVSEEVTITLGEPRVTVDAVFQMHNTGAAATVRMGYPLGSFETALNDFAVSVDARPCSEVRTQAGAGDAPAHPRAPAAQPQGVAAEAYRFQGPYKEWKVFDVPFAADQTRTVRVTYWVEPARVVEQEKGPLLFYSYTLKTGATWKGTIGQATLRVRLDKVAPQRLVRLMPAGSQASENGTLLTWTMKDFKPTDDLEITFRPSAVAAR